MKIKPNPNSTDTTSALTIAFEPGRLDLKIIQVAPSSLLPHPRNARTHSRKQIRELRKSLRKFGFLNPVLTGSDNVIVAGHARVQAAMEEGLPTIAVEFADPDGHMLEIYWGLDQVGSDGITRPPSEWKGARSLEEAIDNPVRGQDTTVFDERLIRRTPK